MYILTFGWNASSSVYRNSALGGPAGRVLRDGVVGLEREGVAGPGVHGRDVVVNECPEFERLGIGRELDVEERVSAGVLRPRLEELRFRTLARSSWRSRSLSASWYE